MSGAPLRPGVGELPRGSTVLKAFQRDTVPACVYLLADNLDAALAAGEDLIKSGTCWPEGQSSDPSLAGAQRWAIGRIQTHEMSLVTRILQARKHARELARIQGVFRAISHLFVASLHDLEDFAQDSHSQSVSAFDGGQDMVAYLRSRSVIASDAAGALPSGSIDIGDAFRLAGRIPLGVVLDLIGEFLDALDVQFDLYPEREMPAPTLSSADGRTAA